MGRAWLSICKTIWGTPFWVTVRQLVQLMVGWGQQPIAYYARLTEVLAMRLHLLLLT